MIGGPIQYAIGAWVLSQIAYAAWVVYKAKDQQTDDDRDHN